MKRSELKKQIRATVDKALNEPREGSPDGLVDHLTNELYNELGTYLSVYIDYPISILEATLKRYKTEFKDDKIGE